MSSLASLPPELTDLVFSHLTTRESSKVRLINKSHNERFQEPFRTTIFTHIYLTFDEEIIDHFARISSSDAGFWIQHITFSDNASKDRVPNYDWFAARMSSTTPLTLTDAFKCLPNLRTVDFDDTCTTEYGATAWKKLIVAISSSKVSTIETLRTPQKTAMVMSDLKISPSEMKWYRYGFRNLKTLEMRTRVQYERPGLTENLWTWIAKVGTKLEDLTIWNSRTSRKKPTPNQQGGFLPQDFNLPELKSIRINDLFLAVRDVKLLLSNNSDKIETINLSNCRMDDQKKDWFDVLKFLKTKHFTELTNLRLALSGYYDRTTEYDLPELTVTNSNWATVDATCEIRLRSGVSKHYVVRKSLWNELDETDATVFWTSLTNGKWESKRATRWKRIESARQWLGSEARELGNPDSLSFNSARYQHLQDECTAKIRRIDTEVDSDCEGVE
ncbi:hypothetical protein TWF281_008860 [Arthrobotrys megalospora]